MRLLTLLPATDSIATVDIPATEANAPVDDTATPASSPEPVSAVPVAPAPSSASPSPRMPQSEANAIAPDSTATDTTAATGTTAHDTISYIILEPPAAEKLPSPSLPAGADGMSWILTSLTLLFIVVAIRFRTNSKYLSAIFRDAVEVRERRNVFDETVREESFILILNSLWCLSVGVLLYTTVQLSASNPFISTRLAQAGLTALPPGGFPPGVAPLGMAISIGVALVWQLMMVALYTIVGRVFSDAHHTRMWVTGYLAVSGLATLIFFPLALLAICNPADTSLLLWVALGGFIIAKLIFIIKGFRIFFKEVTSWLLFLYYLCSLEIVPLVLLYVSTLLLCATIL